jgi:hypothetical protein
MLTNVPYGRGLFERHVDNPIIRARDLPYRCNTVFNAAAAQVDGEGQPVGSDMTSPPLDFSTIADRLEISVEQSGSARSVDLRRF